jgi:xanthine dehydrogenase iron-sulfur cluster and FAD-binding subunit A
MHPRLGRSRCRPKRQNETRLFPPVSPDVRSHLVARLRILIGIETSYARRQLGMTGTKYGCGIAQCGACTVHIDGVATRSCSVQFSDVAGKQITTIEGLAAKATDLMKIIGRELDCCSTLQGIAFWHFRN